MKRVFLSYSRHDQGKAVEIVNDLSELNCDVWYDKDLSGGQSWWNTVLRQVMERDIFCVVISPNLLQSEACMRELEYAIALRRNIFPIIVQQVELKTAPSHLRAVNWLDYTGQDKQAGLGIAKAIISFPKALPLPDPLPKPPLIPISYEGDQLRSIKQKVDCPDSLNWESQIATVSELRRLMAVPEVASDARALLLKMKTRADLLARVAEDIDLIIGKKEPRSNSTQRSVPQEEKSKWKYFAVTRLRLALLTCFVSIFVWWVSNFLFGMTPALIMLILTGLIGSVFTYRLGKLQE